MRIKDFPKSQMNNGNNGNLLQIKTIIQIKTQIKKKLKLKKIPIPQ